MKFKKGNKVSILDHDDIVGTVEKIITQDKSPKAIVFIGYLTKHDQYICNGRIYVSRLVCGFSSLKKV